MLRQFKRLPIAIQAAIMLLLMLISTASTFIFWAHDSAIREELAHARSVADTADSLRSIAAKHGGFYIRRDWTEDAEKLGTHLAEYRSRAADGKEYVFHQKNPFLTVNDSSNAVENPIGVAKFHITSDNTFNPRNQPDAFERQALQTLRTKSILETWDIVNGQMRYTRALRAHSACLACLGSANIVQAKYQPPGGPTKGGGHGYAEGEIIGAISVTMPHVTPLQMFVRQSTGFWVSLTAALTIMIAAYVMVVYGIARPLKRLSQYASSITNADDLSKIQYPTFDKDEMSSDNEIHRESSALKSLQESMQIALDYLEKSLPAYRLLWDRTKRADSNARPPSAAKLSK